MFVYIILLVDYYILIEVGQNVELYLSAILPGVFILWNLIYELISLYRQGIW